MSFSEYSCTICNSKVKETDLAVLCDLCEKWIHTDCASIGKTQCKNLKESPLTWYCPYCIMELPFFRQSKTKTFKHFSIILITINLSNFLKNGQEDKIIPEKVL